VHVAECRPRAECAVTDDELRLVRSAGLEIAHQLGPRLGALAVAVLDREELLDAVAADADHDEQAQPVVLTEAHADVDAVDEPVGVPVEAQLALAERGVLGLPCSVSR
jgi:NAD(P)-dependent dehydrogenase (short-subunit alcohol dehydrogenase family)